MNDLLELSNSRCKQYFTYDRFGSEYLTPAEFYFIANASDERKKEFSAGRFCAKKALNELNTPNAEILVGVEREPIWPPGILGSISHSKHLTGAIVGKEADFFSMGLDIEKMGVIQPDMWDLLYTHDEQFFLRKLPTAKLEMFLTLLFSFKESFYKFQFPVTRQFVDFKDIEFNFFNSRVHVHIVNAHHILKHIPCHLVKFYYKIIDSQVVTLCILEHLDTIKVNNNQA